MGTNLQPWRRTAAKIVVPFYLGLIFGAPALCILWASKLSWLGALPLCLAVPMAYVAMAALLSIPHQRFVVEGRMPLDTAVPLYFHRRLYGLCWTAVYYSGPVYYLMLSVPALRTALFRAFGYRGSMDFTIYPDTWVRDLPLLNFGAGSYLSNKATIGSNMIFIRNGEKIIEVGRINIGKNAMVGHLTMIGPGVEIGDDVQIGVGCGIGRRVRIGERAVIGDTVVLDHGAKVQACAIVTTRSYVGMGRNVLEAEEMAPASNLLRKSIRERDRGRDQDAPLLAASC